MGIDPDKLRVFSNFSQEIFFFNIGVGTKDGISIHVTDFS